MRFQCVATGVRRRDIVLMALSRHIGCPMQAGWDGQSIPILVGFNDGNDAIQIERRRSGHPYIFIDHAYFERRSIEYDDFRICLNHFHTTDWRDTAAVIKCQPWHTGADVIVIPPTPLVQKVYEAHTWTRNTVQTLASHTDRRIIVKEKGNGVLAEMLPNAHAVVSFGSVAEVEAARHGVPVFTTCGPSLPVAQTDFSKIETPIYPDREKWLSALAGAEHHISRIDAAWRRILPLLGG